MKIRQKHFAALVGVIATLLAATAVPYAFPGLSASVADQTPVASVNGEFVSFASYRQRVQRNLRLWEGTMQGDELLEAAETAALDELIREAVVRSALAQAGLSVSEDAIDQEYVRMSVLAGGSGALSDELDGYDWSEKEFKEGFVRAAVERTTLHMATIASAEGSASEQIARDKAIVAAAEHRTSVPFPEPDGSNGGSFELGWTDVQSLDPWFFEAVRELPAGAVSDPIRSPIGYHVLFAEDERTSPYGGRELYLHERLFSVPSTFDWQLREYEKESSVNTYLPDLRWENGAVRTE